MRRGAGPLTLTRRIAPLIAAYAVIFVVYLLVAYATADQPFGSLESPIDRVAPFSPPWVLVYVAVYTQALAPACILTHPRVLDRTVFSYLSIYLVAVPLWLFYPVGVPRGPLPIVDVWTYGVAMVRALDPPTNCFPSMHVAFATLAALVVRRHDRLGGGLLLSSAALISVSTVLIDQHWLADCVLGAALAAISYRLWVAPLPDALFSPLPRRWHGAWLGLYVVMVVSLMTGWWWGWVPLDWLNSGGVVGAATAD